MAAKPRPAATEATAGKPKGKLVGAVVSAAKVLRFLRATQGPCTVTQIMRAVEINPSTCFNILRTLIQEDFVQFDRTAKTYQLSLGIVALARGALEHSHELHVLKPRIEALSRKHRMMVAIWRKISDERMMLVSTAESDAPVRIHARIGARSPLLLGASGRVFATYSGMSRQVLKERFDELRLDRPLAFKDYLEQLEQVRRLGWSIDEGYVTPGTVTIAVPVRQAGDTVNFACAAILFNGQYDLQRIASIAEDLKHACGSVMDAGVQAQEDIEPPAKAARKRAATSAVASAPATTRPRKRATT